jgi:hypothetical protein
MPPVTIVVPCRAACHSAAPCSLSSLSCHVVVPPVAVIMPPVAVVVPPAALLPLASAARHRRRAESSCRPSPFVFLGGQSEEIDLTKAQWRRP